MCWSAKRSALPPRSHGHQTWQHPSELVAKLGTINLKEEYEEGGQDEDENEEEEDEEDENEEDDEEDDDEEEDEEGEEDEESSLPIVIVTNGATAGSGTGHLALLYVMI